MKGQAIPLTRKTITVLITAVVLVGAMFFIYQIGLVSMMKGMCGNGYCDEGETKFLCPIDCWPTDVKYFMEQLVIINDSSDTYGSLHQQDPVRYTKTGLENAIEYLKWPWPIDEYKEDCINNKQCTECNDVQDFVQGFNCEKCIACDDDELLTDESDPLSKDCTFCSECQLAKSDYEVEIGLTDFTSYSNCGTCLGCTGCDFKDGETEANHCDQCEACETCEPDVFTDEIYDCWYCSYKQGANEDYTGCMQCYINGKLGEDQDQRSSNYCNKCQSNSDGCDNQEPQICDRIKKCIQKYNGEPCTIDAYMPVLEANTNSDADIIDAITTAVSKCKISTASKDENIYRELSDNSRQFLCKFTGDSIAFSELSPIAVFHENRTYLMCGDPNPSYYNQIIYNNLAFNPNPDGMTYKLTVGGVDYFSGTDSNECRFSLFLCGQPALKSINMYDESTYKDENDEQIQETIDEGTFDEKRTEEPEILKDPLLMVYTNIFSMDEDDFYKGEAKYVVDAGNYFWIDKDVFENGFSTKSFVVDFGTKGTTPEQIADAIVAGIQDWNLISKYDANTIENVIDVIPAYTDDKWDDRIDISGVSKIELDTGSIQWRMVEIDKDIYRPSECTSPGTERYLWTVYGRQASSYTNENAKEEIIVNIPNTGTMSYKNDYWNNNGIMSPNIYGTNIRFEWLRNDTDSTVFPDKKEDFDLRISTESDGGWDDFPGTDNDDGNNIACNDNSGNKAVTIKPESIYKDKPDIDKTSVYEKDYGSPYYNYVKISDKCNIKSYNICFEYALPDNYGAIYYEKTDDGLLRGNIKFQIIFKTWPDKTGRKDGEVIAADKIMLYPMVSFAEVAG